MCAGVGTAAIAADSRDNSFLVGGLGHIGVRAGQVRIGSDSLSRIRTNSSFYSFGNHGACSICVHDCIGCHNPRFRCSADGFFRNYSRCICATKACNAGHFTGSYLHDNTICIRGRNLNIIRVAARSASQICRFTIFKGNGASLKRRCIAIGNRICSIVIDIRFTHKGHSSGSSRHVRITIGSDCFTDLQSSSSGIAFL